MTNWFVKSRRAQNVDDFETWVEKAVTPTLNAFENNGDTRATVLIFYGNRVDDIRMQGAVINTLQARMGTGGNNMPMVAITEQDQDMAHAGNFELYDFPKEEVSPSLNARRAKDTLAYEEGTVVRRLTPRECERLQGFPDDWTASQSDSQRYKQMGNAVAVPVVQWVINRLVEVNNERG
jgi:DNA (cytosine-5)-methyltransferase 1